VPLHRIKVSFSIELRILKQVRHSPQRVNLATSSHDWADCGYELEFYVVSQHKLCLSSINQLVGQMLEKPSSDEVFLKKSNPDVLDCVLNAILVAPETIRYLPVYPLVIFLQEFVVCRDFDFSP
jgi:hypothetical protein